MAEQKRHMDVPQGAVFGKPFPRLARHQTQKARRVVVPSQKTKPPYQGAKM